MIGRRATTSERPWDHFQPFVVVEEGSTTPRDGGLLEIIAPDRAPFVFPDEAKAQYYLRRVLHGREYPALLPNIFQATTILDIGGQVGSAARYFAARYPDARIVSIEPTPESFALLTRNTQHLPRVERHRLAFAATRGTLRIWRGLHSSGQNSAMPNAENRDTYFDAEAVVPLEFCRTHSLDAISIVKLDIEGMELEVLENLVPMLERIDVIYLEYHSEALRRSIDALLSTFTLFASEASEGERGTVAYVRTDLYGSLLLQSERYVFSRTAR